MNKVIIPLEEYERLKDIADAFSYKHTIVRNGDETEYLTTDEVVAELTHECNSLTHQLNSVRKLNDSINAVLEAKDCNTLNLGEHVIELNNHIASLKANIKESDKSNAKRIMVISAIFCLILLIINLIGMDQPKPFSAIALIVSCTFMVINIFKFGEFK